MCSAVFITGLAPDFAAENVGFFTAPYEVRTILGKPVIDRANQAVHVTLPNGVTRTAKYLGSQGSAFEPPEALTAAFIVTWKGRLIAERYAYGVEIRTTLEGWSMGKSITATLFGILLNKGVAHYRVDAGVLPALDVLMMPLIVHPVLVQDLSVSAIRTFPIFTYLNHDLRASPYRRHLKFLVVSSENHILTYW